MKYAQGFNVKEAQAASSYAGAGTPANVTRSFKASEKESVVDFAKEFLDTDKAVAGTLYYVVMTKPVNDSRSKPYKVTHVPSGEKRTYNISYQIFDASGKKLDSKSTKAEALVAAKDLVTELKESVNVVVAKEVSSGNPITATVDYSPSKNTRVGNFMFFMKEASE